MLLRHGCLNLFYVHWLIWLILVLNSNRMIVINENFANSRAFLHILLHNVTRCYIMLQARCWFWLLKMIDYWLAVVYFRQNVYFCSMQRLETKLLSYLEPTDMFRWTRNLCRPQLKDIENLFLWYNLKWLSIFLSRNIETQSYDNTMTRTKSPSLQAIGSLTR